MRHAVRLRIAARLHRRTRYGFRLNCCCRPRNLRTTKRLSFAGNMYGKTTTIMMLAPRRARRFRFDIFLRFTRAPSDVRFRSRAHGINREPYAIDIFRTLFASRRVTRTIGHLAAYYALRTFAAITVR
jgi:hypothetical protein